MSAVPDPMDLDLLDRYFAGDCVPDEVAAVERWVAQHPDHARYFDAFRAEFDVAIGDPPPSDAGALWDRIAAGMEQGTGRSGVPGRVRMAGGSIPLRIQRGGSSSLSIMPPTRRWRSYATRAAALVAIVAGAAVLRAWVFSHAPEPGISAHTPPHEYVTTTGQRADLRLADGTRVVLAPESRLTVAANYDSTNRIVTLEGQGYFDVVHNAARPFAVRAGNALVRDVGTRFDVRAFRNEPTVRVVVSHGKVQLGRPAVPEAVDPLMVAGDLGRLGATGALSIEHHVDTTKFLAWTRGDLVFDHTPIHEALADIARWYGVDVRLAGTSFERRTLTATLHDRSLATVVDLVALSLDARAVREGRMVTLHPRTAGVTP